MSRNTQGYFRPCCGDADSVFYSVFGRNIAFLLKKIIKERKYKDKIKGKEKKCSHISDVLQAPFQTTEIKYLNKGSHTKFLISRCI